MRKFIPLLFMLFFASSLQAQILDILKDKIKEKAGDKITALAGSKVQNLITTEAITTNFRDCNTQNIKNKNFGEGKNYQSLCSADFTENGYALKPGFYEIKLKTFCLKAGTHAPSRGDGYLYAPLKGPKKEIVDRIVKNWRNHPEIAQTDVQSLLWAIIAKSSFKTLSPELQMVAAKLLTPKDILSLSKMGLDFVPSNIMSSVKSNLPKPVQLVLEAENKMRQLFSSGSYSYAELENIAMLAGVNPQPSEIAYGTWGLHPKGFWIAYEPQGYLETTVKIYVPETAGTVYYVPSDDVAVPASDGSQRLLMSDVKDC